MIVAVGLLIVLASGERTAEPHGPLVTAPSRAETPPPPAVSEHAPSPLPAASDAAAAPPPAGSLAPPAVGTPVPAPPPRTLAIVVVDADDNPVAGAQVEAFAGTTPDLKALMRSMTSTVHRPTPRQSEQFEAGMQRFKAIQLGEIPDDPTWYDPVGQWRTDADGKAEVVLSAGETCLVATHDPQGSSGVMTVRSAEDEDVPTWTRLKLMPREALNGRVLDVSGHPAAGAHVSFFLARTFNETERRARLPRPLDADSDGRFSIEVDTTFFAQVRAELDGRRSPRESVHVGPGRPGDIELRFAGAVAVTGVVLDPDGAPVPDASVRVGGYKIPVDPVTSDEHGRFRLELARECHVVVLAKVKGFVPAESVAATLTEAQPVADVVLRVVKPETISGRVEWADGAPIARVAVLAHPASPDFGSSDMAVAAQWLSQDEDDRNFTFGLGDMTSTDGDGHFHFQAIHPRYLQDLLCLNGDDRLGPGKVEGVRPGTQDVRIIFDRIREGADRIRGCVIDAETAAPIERYEVKYGPWDVDRDRRFGSSHVTIDDAQGRFELSGLVLDKEYSLVVEAAGYPSKVFGPLKPSTDAECELALGRHASLRLIVTNPDDEPQSGAAVQLMEGAPRSFAAIFAEVPTRVTGPDGILVWPELKPGEHSIEAVAGRLRSSRQRLDLPPGRVTVVQLVVQEPGGSGTLEVRATRKDGSPWIGAEVKAVLYVGEGDTTPDLEPVYAGSTGGDARFVLDRLTPGTYIVDVSGDATIIPLERVEVPSQGTAVVTFAGGK